MLPRRPRPGHAASGNVADVPVIDEGGVDLNVEGLIEKQSLWEFQEMLALVLHWND